MSDYEMLSIVLAIIAIVVLMLKNSSQTKKVTAAAWKTKCKSNIAEKSAFINAREIPR